jgi:hypothetical protein
MHLLEGWEPRDVVALDFINDVAFNSAQFSLIFVFKVGNIEEIVPQVVFLFDMENESFLIF